MTLEEKMALAERLTARADAYRRIQNVISGFTYYLRAQDQQGAFTQYWSAREDIAFGAAEGRQAVIDFLITNTQKEKNRRQEIVHRIYGEPICPEHDGIGDLESRAVTAPYIIVAGDLQTAQGLWFSPAVKAQVGEDGRLQARYLQERLAVDFIHENGLWKIWHFFIIPELTAPLASELFDDNYSGRTFDMDAGPKESTRNESGHRCIEIDTCNPSTPSKTHTGPKPYGPTKVPSLEPPLPAAYACWTPAETMPLHIG